MAEAPVTYRGVVYPWHCDHIGHMNVTWYMGKFDEATWNLFAMLGITPGYLRDNGRGMAAVEMHIRYLRELHAGDVVEVRTSLTEIGGKVIRFTHEMFNGETGDLCAVNEVTGVHMDTTARKACPFPENISARASVLVVREGEEAGHG
jgi:acyl-CoA thioester hydrolase